MILKISLCESVSLMNAARGRTKNQLAGPGRRLNDGSLRTRGVATFGTSNARLGLAETEIMALLAKVLQAAVILAQPFARIYVIDSILTAMMAACGVKRREYD